MPERGSDIFYHPRVVSDDIPKLGNTARKQIRRVIETKLALHPEVYGLPLRGTLKKYWKLRIGQYRVVYEIKDNHVRIIVISHRKHVYEMATRRT